MSIGCITVTEKRELDKEIKEKTSRICIKGEYADKVLLRHIEDFMLDMRSVLLTTSIILKGSRIKYAAYSIESYKPKELIIIRKEL